MLSLSKNKILSLNSRHILRLLHKEGMDIEKNCNKLFKIKDFVQLKNYFFNDIESFLQLIKYLKSHHDTFFKEVFNFHKISLFQEKIKNLTLQNSPQEKTEIYKNLFQLFLNLHITIEQNLQKKFKDQDFLEIPTDGEIIDTRKNSNNKIELYLLLDNLRSSFNVGSIFRTAECLGIKKIYLSGYSPSPLEDKVSSTSMGTASKVLWEKIDSPLKLIHKFKTKGKVLALESFENTKSIYQNQFSLPCLLLLGNEKYGISSELLKIVDETYHIPMHGWKNSLNVGVAFAVAGFEIRRQFDTKSNKT